MERLMEIIQNKGLIIGLVTALLKGVIQLRKKDFVWLVFFTDLFLGLVVGYISWELVKEIDVNLFYKIVYVGFFSGNAFEFLNKIFDKNLTKIVFSAIMLKVFKIEIGKNKNIPKK